MQYRRFGSTELQMPVFTCGGMRYPLFRRDLPPWLLLRRHQRHVDSIVDAALDAGITHFETARDYGTSERQLGQSLRRHDRSSVLVQTKVAPQPDSNEFRRLVEDSLRRLGFDHIDLLAIHGINTQELMDQTLRAGGCWEQAQRMQEQGLCTHIGFSTHGTTRLIQQLIRSGRFSFVNLHWYYINQNNAPAIATAAREDLGVFIISPSDKGGRLYDPPDKLRRLCEPLSPMAFNDLFCLARPEVHTLSIGAARPSDFAEHVSVVEQLGAANSPVAAIDARWQTAAIERLGAAWMTTWQDGLPTFDETPGQINIPVILWLRNLALAFDMHGYARMRYNLLGQASHWFPGNNALRLDEYDLTDCLRHSPHAAQVPALLEEAHQLLVGKPRKRWAQGGFFGRGG